MWGSSIVRSFAEIVQHPHVRLGSHSCAKLRGQKNNRAAAKTPHVGFYVNMKVMIGRISFYGVRDSSRQ